MVAAPTTWRWANARVDTVVRPRGTHPRPLPRREGGRKRVDGWGCARYDYSMQRIPPEMTRRARVLRREATPAERVLWQLLSTYRPRFTRQLVVDDFILDLACREVRMAVELDGGQHVDNVDYDARRTAYLEAAGWQVLRFWNNEVMGNPVGVAEAVLLAVVGRLPAGTHRRPLPRREGRRRGGHALTLGSSQT